jgi:hypothetical protein
MQLNTPTRRDTKLNLFKKYYKNHVGSETGSGPPKPSEKSDPNAKKIIPDPLVKRSLDAEKTMLKNIEGSGFGPFGTRSDLSGKKSYFSFMTPDPNHVG